MYYIKKLFISQERQHNILINGKDTGTNGLSLFTYPQIFKGINSIENKYFRFHFLFIFF